MIGAFSSPCETAGTQADAGDQQPSLGAGDRGFEVLGQAPVASKPCEGSLDHPAFRLRLEGADSLRTGDDLDRPAAGVGKRVEQLLPAIDAIGEDVAQFREAPCERSQQRHRAMIILNVGRKDAYCERRAGRIGHQMTLASLHSLGRIKSAWTATFCGLDALTVDHAGGRSEVAPDSSARTLDQCEVDPPPDALIAPKIKVVLNG